METPSFFGSGRGLSYSDNSMKLYFENLWDTLELHLSFQGCVVFLWTCLPLLNRVLKHGLVQLRSLSTASWSSFCRSDGSSILGGSSHNSTTPLVSSAPWMGNPRSEWSFLARKIIDFYSPWLPARHLWWHRRVVGLYVRYVSLVHRDPSAFFLF